MGHFGVCKMRSQPVHILQVLPAFESGGVERATLDMARFLASSDASGIKSSVASQGGKLVEEIERLGMDHYLLPLKAKKSSYNCKKWIRACQIGASSGDNPDSCKIACACLECVDNV